MIAHLVRKRMPPKSDREVVCITCGIKVKTQVHYVIYCLGCGQPNRVPPIA